MADPYTPVVVTNYNLNPPPDDGSQVAANRVAWSTQKEKLGDPLKDAVEEIDTNLTAAFGKVIGGGGVTSTGTNYTILAADQGKLVRATAASITITTPSAVTVSSPFVVGVLNNSSGTITLDGNGTQTIDGSLTLTLGPGQGCFLCTDGTNWFTFGLGAIPAGNQMTAGQIINGTIAESNGSNAVTFAIKTLAGTDPSATDPVVITFRNSTAGTGNYVYRSITAATSIVIPSTALMGASNGVAFRLWLGLLDNAGTPELFAINCLNSTSIYPFGQFPLITTVALGTGSDSAHVAYSTTLRSAKAYVPLGYASYESGLATAGSWNVSPTRLQLFGPGVPLPGQEIQVQQNYTGALATGTTAMANDDTIPQNGEGTQWMSQAITPTSAANLLEIESTVCQSESAGGVTQAALFQDSTANALTAAYGGSNTSNFPSQINLSWAMVAGTTSATTLKVRGGSPGGTTTFNGSASARVYGGVMNSFVRVRERMA